jgi:hypothetical protein
MEDFSTWTKIKMIGIAQNDLCINIFLKECALYAFTVPTVPTGIKMGV